METVVENKVLTHDAFVEGSLLEWRPKTVIHPRVLSSKLAEHLQAQLPATGCVLKLGARARGCGIVPVGSPSELEDVLKALLLEGS
eukprot:26779-Amphidinium_carterae.1